MRKRSKRIYRHGGLLLVAVRKAPAGERRARENGRLVLAHGEVTGHAHVITDEQAELVELVTPNEAIELYLLVHGTQPVVLTHEEHDTLLIEPGNYQVRRQREYAPKEIQEIRQVAD
jgi:hypothetical protein